MTTAGAPADVRHYVFDQSGRMLGEYGASAATVKAETIWLTPDAANDNGAYGGGDGADGYAPLALAGRHDALLGARHPLGVPLVITDSGGNTAAPTGYTKVGFPGQTQTLSDLYCNRYRDYDPTTGRYIQADPIGLAGGANPYLHAADERRSTSILYTDDCVTLTPPSAFAIAGGRPHFIGNRGRYLNL